MTTFLTKAQMNAEIARCEYCEDKPCQKACPVHCSPMDFIKAVKLGRPSDYKRSTSIIMSHNPLGGVCGAVCPDYHCMKGCVHRTFDRAINIPDLQATIVQEAKNLGVMPEFSLAKPNGRRVAIIGAGPAGLGAASILAQKGYVVEIFERDDKAGGMCHLIPDHRLNKNILNTDIDFVLGLGRIKINFNQTIEDPIALLKQGFDAVIVSVGLDNPMKSDIPGKDNAYDWIEYLKNSKNIPVKHKNVAVIGGGAIGVDAAVTAKRAGAKLVDIIYRRNLTQMRLTEKEHAELLEYEIGVVPRTIITEILGEKTKHSGLKAIKVNIPHGEPFESEHIIAGSETILRDYELVIFAIGTQSQFKKIDHERIFYAGDYVNGASTVVEATASGKNAALKVDALLSDKPIPIVEKDFKSTAELAGIIRCPVSLETEFFGRKIRSPFLLSASPPTDGYDQMKKAYDAGWAGGVMKTAFDNVPIHIPSEYMFVYSKETYGNCDNVSAHPLDRVCKEIKKLVKEYPDRLTMGSTGGPVTGNDAHDKTGWQSNTKKLDHSGAMAIEYSLSCPQGGDGTEGDIVSQNAELSAKIIDWVMEVSDPDIPKLFKLTSAVTSIYPIVTAIKKVFSKYPNKKAGITLANSFPTLAFRESSNKNSWDEGIIVGMSGEAVAPISNLVLANVSKIDVAVSGNGGPMNYKEAADFLALGVKTVQFCTVAMKDGIHVLEELESGLSYYMQSRNIYSMKDLIGCALPKPITDFMDLSPIKKVSSVDETLCEHCGNCTRCPYLAITLNEKKIPVIDSERCVGCSICVKKCFANALAMVARIQD